MADERAMRASLDAAVRSLDLDLRAPDHERLLGYTRLLDHWNRAYNLTGTRGAPAILARHVIDCLALARWPAAGGMVDIGTGAGLPGLVLAIARPDLEAHLVDGAAKRIRFVRHAIDALGVANARAHRSRAEDFLPGEAVRTVISRATLPVIRLVELARGWLCPGGRVLAMKGRRPDDELAALDAAGIAHEVVALAVPGLDEARHLVVVPAPEVEGSTSTEYA